MRQRARWLGLGVAALTGLALSYAVVVRTEVGQRLDEWSGGLVRALLPGFVGDAVSQLARPGLLVVAAFAFLLLLPWAVTGGRWRETIGALIVVLGATSLALELRSRTLSRPDLGVGGYSENTFPSTHAAAGFSLVVGVLLLWPGPVRRVHLWWAAATVLLVGAGNVTSYAHRPADVLGSLLLVGTVTGLVGVVTGAHPGAREAPTEPAPLSPTMGTMPSPMRQHAGRPGTSGPALNGKWLAQPLTGTQRYAHEITRRLVESRPGAFVVHVPGNAVVPEWLAQRATVRRSRLRGTAFEQVALPWAARSRLLVSLGGPAPLLARRQVASMHDASAFRVPETYSRTFARWYRLMYRVLVRRAPTVLTVSEFSAHDLAEVLHAPPGRFTVVPNGSDHVDAVGPRRPDLPLPPGPWVLCVGTLARHKNLAPTVEALTAAGLDVVVVGAAGSARVFGAREQATLAKAVVAGRLEDEELAWLYRHADALVFPSLYEGFGLPVVEAQRLSCPVICSDAASLPEVAGEGALLFDARRPEAAAQAVLRLRSDPDLRADLVARGRLNTERFLWARSAALIEDACGLEARTDA